MTQMTPKIKNIMVIAGAFTACYALIMLVAQPIYSNQQNVDKKIQDKILFIQKYQEILKQKSYYKAKIIKNKSTNTILSKKFLNETKPALAAALQQNLLESLARQAGVNIIRVRVDKPKYMEKLLSISTQVTIGSTLKDLTHFVYLLENNKKFLVIEEVSVERTNNKKLEELKSQLTIRGFIKTIQEGKTKAI